MDRGDQKTRNRKGTKDLRNSSSLSSRRVWQQLSKRFRTHCKANRARCWICRQAIDYDAPSQTPTAFETDHRVPVSTDPGLALSWGNLRPAHVRCNRTRRSEANDDPSWVQPNW